jgi:light-regulated signal transduction histidine kinase (bacteriophytochrome)
VEEGDISSLIERSLGAYPALVNARPTHFEPEPWGEDPKLAAVLGARGAAGFRELLRIFDLFSRVDRRTEGIGIGLSVCRRIVEAHGGRIWVEPADGVGSAFRFTLSTAPLERSR